ncbi:MAG: hypothetical protein HY868_12805 [Chloroflexi bacterium]|nr:hypothetical protein [Chloroflexota bacterium]
MALWEVCRIKHVCRVKGFMGFEFGKDVAVLDTPNGEQAIDETPEFRYSQGEEKNCLRNGQN